MWRLKQLWKEFKRSIKSFLLWFPVLFADRWFDYSYLMRIIERKCDYDAEMYLKHGVGSNNLTIACDLHEVAQICHRLQDVDLNYYDQFLTPHNDKWKEAHQPSLYPRTDTSKSQELTEFLAAADKGNAAMQIDLNRLTDLFKKVYTWSD
jgi:hypothetical protein